MVIPLPRAIATSELGNGFGNGFGSNPAAQARRSGMAGHIQKRGDSWRLHAFIGRDEGGKDRYTSKTFRGTRR